MAYDWLAIAAVIAVQEWVAVEREIRPLEYFAKPGAVLALTIWLWQASGFQGVILCFGALLFFISDSLLAWTMFDSRLSHDRPVSMMTYHLGQALIVLGSAFHFME